ncbi:hypothetical protein HMF8227_02546 [Saliniradius amylolyticus]|uniref:Uncharacterized protein n=2 Tax=Saliniradius amylolyticus TaxID=2183582 RepID=A0A2S2E5R0_9ALTE|nr:hypothetical protein HMF8227_02546 [Saliniradius amylolyticus]
MSVTLEFDFNQGLHSWQAGFSDFPPGDKESYALESGIEMLPNKDNQQGFYLKGFNKSDDLFMFMKRPISELVPNTHYTLSGSVTFLSNAGKSCSGIGGAPGESVYVKLGASEIEPEQADYYMNIDIGSQSHSGNDALVMGNIAVDNVDCSGGQFEEKTLTLEDSRGLPIQTSENGDLWILLGTDSGFEGVSEVFYTSITLTLSPA